MTETGYCRILLDKKDERIETLEKENMKIKQECSKLLDKLYLSGLSEKQIVLVEKMQDVLGV